MNIQTEINNFLDLVLERDSKLEKLSDLISALDKLAISTHQIEFEFDDKDYLDNSTFEYSEIRKKVENRFPDLGLYNIVRDVCDKVGDTQICTGDAIDDITDITLDLLNIRWRFENTSTNDALWNYELLFRTHWGRHLRNLQLYLHDLYL
jgi:hypothetical protein|tara:strand:+ start:541 stop:990 length:450 start_codon:yes stop_codon:yes gene_type:complete